MLRKILTLNQMSSKGLERLPCGGYEVATEFANPDAILLRSYKLQEQDISASVLAIARAGAGVNNIPVAACTARGIPVFNSPGANANAVKELVATGLLLGSRGVIDGIDYVGTLHGIDDESELNKVLEAHKKKFKGSELVGKTLGVVGLGAIGSLVAEMGLTLGMNVIGFDPALSVEAAWRLSSQVQKADTLSALFARCDYISLHLPVLDSTRGLVNAQLLDVMQPEACLLNFARQEIVDQAALLKSLENGNVRNSVNFPALQLERESGCRLSLTNENIPKVLGNVLSILADENINVIDMLNKSRDELAYNLIDIGTQPEIHVLKKMRALDGVINVRLIGDCAA